MTRAIVDIAGLALLVPVYYWIVREEWQRRGVFRWNQEETPFGPSSEDQRGV